MDGSDKEILKDDLLREKSESDEKHVACEAEGTCQEKELLHDTPLDSSGNLESGQCSEKNRKMSTDNMRKDSDLSDFTNIQDSDLSATDLKKYGKELNSVTSHYRKRESIEKFSDQTDYPSTDERNIQSSGESSSTIKKIKASIIKYFSCTMDQSESDKEKTLHLEKTVDEISNEIIKILNKIKYEANINQQSASSSKPLYQNIVDSTNIQIHISSEDDTKILEENLIEQVEDGKKLKIPSSESTCPKCKQDVPLTPIISPGKRKSEKRVEDEVKRKRSACNAIIEVGEVENLLLLHSDLNKHEKDFVNETSIDDTVEGYVKEQLLTINQTDPSPIKHKIIETGKIDYETHELEANENINTPDQTHSSDKVPLLDEYNASSTGNRPLSITERSLLLSLLDNEKQSGIINPQNEMRDIPIFENRLNHSIFENIRTTNLSQFQDFPENPKLKFPKKAEDKFVKFPSSTDINVSSDVPLKMSQISSNTSEFENANVNKSSIDQTEDSLPRQDIRGQRRKRVSRFSPLTLFSTPESDLNSIFKEPQSRVINLESMENDPEFIQSQKQILESIYLHREQISTVKPESDDEMEINESLINSNPKEVISEIPLEDASRILKLVAILWDNMKSQGKNVKYIDASTLTSLLIELAEMHDPDAIPYIPAFVIKYRDSPREQKIAYIKSIKKFLESIERPPNPVPFAEGYADTLPHMPPSPIHSPPKNKQDPISKTDSPELKEYPGIADDPTKVKKDARYQKKFYKRKNPVMLPINWSGHSTFPCEKEPKIHSEGNEMQRINDNPRIASGNSENVINEEKFEDSKIILTSKDLYEEKKSEDTPLAEESPRVKLDQRHKKRCYTQNLVPLPINWSVDGDSPSEPNTDSDKDQLQKINDDTQHSSKNKEYRLYEESDDPKDLLKHKNMGDKKEKSCKDMLSGMSESTSGYRISSFIEESPNSSQSNSPNEDEFKLPSILKIASQLERLAARSMSMASQLSRSLAAPSRSPSSLAGPSGSPSSLAGPSGSPSSVARPSGSPSSVARPSGSPSSVAAPSWSPTSPPGKEEKKS